MFSIGTATDYNDLLERLNTFLTAKGSAFGLAYSGSGDGRLTDYSGGPSSVAETFTITATPDKETVLTIYRYQPSQASGRGDSHY